ncbi:MAG: putative Two-component histidine kinase [Geminicoccaceae bacterium]|nr:putative Two-component histidine kinase [Geminicoccaceae bacterium]
MRRRTLTLRLIAASAIWIVVTLCAAGLLLLLLFQDHIERRFDAALADHLQELAAASEVGQDGTLQLSWQPFDPRFNRPQSGWYWQIEQGDAIVERSQSLWPERLRVGPASADDRIQELTGPGGKRLRAVVTPITLPGAPGGFVYTIAGPAVDVHQDVREFGAKLAVTLTVLALGLVGAVVAQVHYGLLPLKRMRRALAQVRSGAARRLTESFPGEVRPLVHELNALLDHNAALLERARTQTGNLAHALKNPLTVIRSEAGAIAAPHGPVLRQQVDLMGRQIEWHLVRARAAGAHGVLGARAAVADVARDLQFLFQGDAQDLEEMLGNLMDNACKWASSRVRLSGTRSGAQLRLAVDDDGPGIAEHDRERVLQRGRRLDETTAGAGLGLAIVRDLAELYRGSLELTRSSLGGLCATLELPAAAPTAGSGQAIDVPLPVGR